MSDLLSHLAQLVAYPSVTPDDAGCQTYILQHLENLGFRCQVWSKNKVSNLYAEMGETGQRLVFAGHTDVVSPGPLEDWNTPPFQLTAQNGFLFGRGVADMKGAVAAMLSLAESWAASPHHGILGFLFTSGEEGDDYLDGTPYVMEQLKQQGIRIDYAIVGEPTSSEVCGDTIKIGRRGSLSGKARIHGIQGHVAYPHLAENALHKALPFLTALSQKKWDEGHAHFPPSTLQITDIHIPSPAGNIIPGTVAFQFNIRYNPLHQCEGIKASIEALAREHQVTLDTQWRLSGEPFLTPHGHLTETVTACIKARGLAQVDLSTSGGTSDARFIAPYGIDVIELGLPNASIHQVNEHIKQSDLEELQSLYLDIAQALLD